MITIKMKSVYIALLLFLFFSLDISTRDKYVKINPNFPYKVGFNNCGFSIMSDSGNKLLKVIHRPQVGINYERYFPIEEQLLNSDTLNLRINFWGFFITDSLPKAFFRFPKGNLFGENCETSVEDTVFFAYKSIKYLRIELKNDSTEIDLIWEMSDFEIAPLWFGDY